MISLCLLIFFVSPSVAQEYNPKTFEKEIAGFDRKDTAENAKPGSNLFVGSSTLRMWQDMQSYFPDGYVINRGFGGSKFEDLLYYADRAIIPYKPAKIFVYEGDNDIAAGIPTAVILRQAKQLREKISRQLPGVPVVFIGAKPSVARWHLKDKYEEFNKALKSYSNKTKQTQFVDVWQPMLDKDGMVYRHIFLQDNLHMKPEGYKIWQKVLTPYLINNNFPK